MDFLKSINWLYVVIFILIVYIGYQFYRFTQLETKIESTMNVYKNEIEKLNKQSTLLNKHITTKTQQPSKPKIESNNTKYYENIVAKIKHILDNMSSALNKDKTVAFRVFNPANMPVEQKRMPVTFISPLLNYYTNIFAEASNNKMRIELEREPFYEVEETESQFKIPLVLKGKLWGSRHSYGQIAISITVIVTKRENSKAINVMDIIEHETLYILKCNLLFFFNNDYQYYDEQMNYVHSSNSVIDRIKIQSSEQKQLDPDAFIKYKNETIKNEMNGRNDIPDQTQTEIYSDSVIDAIDF